MILFIFTAASQALQSSDAFYIFDHFDTFFSIIENASETQVKVFVQAIEILYRTAENLGHLLQPYLNQENLDRQIDYLNLVKMVIYLLVGTIRACDAHIKDTTPQVNAVGRKNKKTNDDQFPYMASYDLKRYEVLVQICNFMDWKIEKLWNLSIAEEEFVK